MSDADEALANLIYQAATEINETGELCLDTHMQLVKAGVEPATVAAELALVVEAEEENE